MKKLRVFQTVKSKRIVSGFSMKNLGTVLLLLFFLPYLFSFLFGNLQHADEDVRAQGTQKQLKSGRMYVLNTTSMGKERIPLEIYVADKLSRTMDGDFEKEALKAQAVLLRSGLLAGCEDGPPEKDISLEDEAYGSGILTEKIMQAVAETSGVYLSYEGEAVEGAYFAVSNGATRDGGALGITDHPYLKRVFCDRDFLSPDYTKTVKYKENEFDRIWEQCDKSQASEEEILKNKEIQVSREPYGVTLYLDSAGYVLYAQRDGAFISGEVLRDAYVLPSTSFHLEDSEGRINFLVRGKGHGIGMSQFAANEMAKEGEGYPEILNYFFQDVRISKFE